MTLKKGNVNVIKDSAVMSAKEDMLYTESAMIKMFAHVIQDGQDFFAMNLHALIIATPVKNKEYA